MGWLAAIALGRDRDKSPSPCAQKKLAAIASAYGKHDSTVAAYGAAGGCRRGPSHLQLGFRMGVSEVRRNADYREVEANLGWRGGSKACHSGRV